MKGIKEVRFLWHTAQLHLQEASVDTFKGDVDKVLRLRNEALTLLLEVCDYYLDKGDCEPTKSIVFYNTAVCAFSLHHYLLAKYYAIIALQSGGLSQFQIEELTSMLDFIKNFY